MLPGFIIEQIRQREADKRYQQYQELTLEIPIPPPYRPQQQIEEEKEERGVIIIDLKSDD